MRIRRQDVGNIFLPMCDKQDDNNSLNSVSISEVNIAIAYFTNYISEIYPPRAEIDAL